MLNTISAILNNGVSAIGDYESISTVTVAAGGQASISFTSIPSTFSHLQIRGIMRPDAATNPPYEGLFRINSDSGSNYSRHRLSGDGATATAGGAASQTYGVLPYHLGSSSTANVFTTMLIDILDYSNVNKNKTVRTLGGYDLNGSGYIQLTSSAWLSTSAVSTFTLFTGSLSNFAQYSQFALYGVK